MNTFDPQTSEPAKNPDAFQPTHEDIAVLAVHLYEEEGCPFGRAQAHWLEAERRLRNKAAGLDTPVVAAVSADERDRLAPS